MTMAATIDTKPRFVGAKGGSGIAQWLISLMPPHSRYVEAFLGTGVVMRTKLKAARNIGIELDPQTINDFWTPRPAGMELHPCDALTVLPTLNLTSHDLVYADPPYLGAVRSDVNRRYYKHDAMSSEWHTQLLTVLCSLKCMVILSGYECDEYNTQLVGWRTAYKWTVNRAGARVKEFVWMNFESPAMLHDARFVGGNYTDRQRVKRKMERWKKNFSALPFDERWAMYDALSSVVDAPPPALITKEQPKQTTLI